MPRSAKEQVDITALLQGILNGYPGNTAIFREYLQNSDDAKATKQIFVLDERKFLIQTLCDPSLQDSQGPAILAFNDGILSDRDWEALRKIHSSSKKADETQTGKNGLGFRASYHLTENPHVFSGETLMILDPHHRFAEHPGGMSIDVVKEGALYRNQLDPFSDFMAGEFSPLSGTVFRLPLRTNKQATESKIKNTPSYVENMRSLLHDFCSVELEQVILFLKNITLIEVRHIDANGHRRVLGSVSIEDMSPALPSHKGITFRKITLRRENSLDTSRVWAYKSLAVDKDNAAKVISGRLGYDVGDSLIADKLFPLIELACPLNGGPISGSLFTLLPLPVKTWFPVHLNAVFALTPDRQNLKNIEEVGTKESRERRLVEWNKAIFEAWTPGVWVDLLEELSSSNAAWSLWPPEERNMYWESLTLNLIKEVLRRNSAIFPAASGTSFLSLENSSTLIASPSIAFDLICLLANLGVKIVQPPAHIFEIVESDSISVAARIFSPETLHAVLETGYRHDQWRAYDPNTIIEIIDYLVFSSAPPSLGNLIGLPWFIQADGSCLTFRRPSVGSTCIIPSSEEEARLFGSQLPMLAWNYTSDNLLSALRAPQSSKILNVASLQPAYIIDVLSRRFADSADAPDIEWILDFWAWLEECFRDFFSHPIVRKQKPLLSGLYLLPTTSGRLRRLSDKVLNFSDSDSSAATAWEKLGVPLLHRRVAARAVLMLSKEGYVETFEKSCFTFTTFLLDHSDVLLQHTLLPDDFEAIRQSLYSVALRMRINSQRKAVLECLSIFSVRSPGGGQPALKSVDGSRLQVNVSDDFPLPYQIPSVIYIDLGDPHTKALVQMLGRIKESDTIALLRMAMDCWDFQPLEIQDSVIDLIFDNWRNLPLDMKKQLEDLPFVSVNGASSRVPPKNLIHPSAPITPLFVNEVGRFPVGRFASGPMVTTMHSLGFLPNCLDQNIVQERVTYFCQSSSQDQMVFGKAKTFVQLLDKNWEDTFSDAIRLHRDRSWMPWERPSTLCSPKESRDCYRDSLHSDPDFYDLVLSVLPKNIVRVSNRDFRSALGWSGRLSTDILVQQLSKTILLAESEESYKRLCKLVGYMSRLHENGDLSLEDLSSIRSELTNRSWIPTSTSPTTVKPEYALFSGEYLKPPFHPINPVGSRSFFLDMGCTERPSLDVLSFELRKYESDTVPTSDLPSVLALLQEIAVNHPGFDRASVLIPDQSRRAHPIDDIYFTDTDSLLPTILQDKFPAHSSVSLALSDQLGIHRLSSLVLDCGEEFSDDDEQMGEDLIDRIRGFLREYDISYAFNEFLANADDARAKELSVLLDCQRTPQQVNGLISSTFREIQGHDMVVLFNDGIFSDHDFKGLRTVGRGGKVGQSDTHGRHGLGALSFYYFTDVVTVISGDQVMILDPSGHYLPLRRGGKRTSLTRKISDIVRQYPEQLRRYEALFNFSMDTTFYQGTLICLPLKSTISEKRCSTEMVKELLEGSYRELSQNAFFFTRLEKIGARMRVEKNEERCLWSLSCHRQESHMLCAGMSYRLLEIASGNTRPRETWMISTSEGTPIPDSHKTAAMGLKLTSMNLTVQLAIRLKPKLIGVPKSWLFSTLRLPRTTSLPFHLNTRFAISSNRQSIVFDSPDSRKARDPKSEFNAWILAEVVPPLYIACLGFIINHRAEGRILSDKQWWLHKHTDDVSKQISQAFHTLLVESDAELFKSIDGAMLSFSGSVFTGPSDPVVHALQALNAPRLVTRYESMATLEAAITVNPLYVRSVIAQISLQKIQSLYAIRTITLDDLLTLLCYISQEEELIGLPLLVLSTDVPTVIPDPSRPRIYLSTVAEHASLFKSAHFLHHKYCADPTLEELWSCPSINAAKLGPNEVQHLICDELNTLSETETVDWLKKFWNHYDNLPDRPSLDCLEQTNIKIIQGSSRRYSLRECRPTVVVYEYNDLKELVLPLQNLGVDTIKPHGSRLLRYFLLKHFPDAVLNVFKCLAAKDITRFDTLAVEEGRLLKHWLATSMEYVCSVLHQEDLEINRDHLLRLEIWVAQTREGGVVRAAFGLPMLPYHFSAQALTPYLLPGLAVMPYSNTIATILGFPRRRKKSKIQVSMDPDEILGAVVIPIAVSTDGELDQFAEFLRNLFSFDIRAMTRLRTLRVFDADRTAQPVDALYDHDVPLFRVCLNHKFFVHPRLRDVGMRHLRALGLNHTISITTFRRCAEAVQDAHQSHVRDGGPARDELFEMARLAFDTYKNILPREIMRSPVHWGTLDCITFVRRKDVRRQGSSYPAEIFCDDVLPLLLPLSRFVLPNLEPIAWTQRAIFFDNPTEDVIAVNQTLGIPDVGEVVAHLKILTTKIAVTHPGNSTLLSDIKATYKWLNEHAEDAREDLLLLGQEKLFLNVDDPSQEWWVDNWITAEELVLNIHCGYGDMKHVKFFLQEYPNLLRNAGCSTMSRISRQFGTTSQDPTRPSLMEVLDDMRKAQKTTDMVLIPRYDAPKGVLDLEAKCVQEGEAQSLGTSDLFDDTNDSNCVMADSSSDIPDDEFADLLELSAHKVILAASAPHVRDWAEDWMHDISHGMDLLYFDGTYFGAKAIIDFIYTSDFNYPVPRMEDVKGLENLLFELLALLRIADSWDMPGLKAKVELEIHRHDLVQRLLPLYPIMIREAKRYNAGDLTDALNQMAEENGALLRRFSLG